MNNLTSDLLYILDKELELYNILLKVSQKKTKIIINGKVSKLEEVVKIEQTIIFKVGKLERKRDEIIEEIVNELKVEKEDLNISNLLKYVEKNEKHKLEELQKMIVNTLKELKNTNELNSKLIKQSLEYIDFSMNMYTSLSTISNDYGGKGMINEENNTRSLFDFKL